MTDLASNPNLEQEMWGATAEAKKLLIEQQAELMADEKFAASVRRGIGKVKKESEVEEGERKRTITALQLAGRSE